MLVPAAATAASNTERKVVSRRGTKSSISEASESAN